MPSPVLPGWLRHLFRPAQTPDRAVEDVRKLKTLIAAMRSRQIRETGRAEKRAQVLDEKIEAIVKATTASAAILAELRDVVRRQSGPGGALPIVDPRSPSLDVDALRRDLNGLPPSERFERVHELEQAAGAIRSDLATLRSQLATDVLEVLRPNWDGDFLKPRIAQLPRRMRSALMHVAHDMRDAAIVAAVTGGGPPVGHLSGDRFGIGFDERVVEIPLALKVARLDEPGEVLDAGSAMNIDVVRQLVPRSTARLTHFTLPGSDEKIWRDDPMVCHEFGDLRALPYADGRFGRIVSVSTLEHVGMDTTVFGAKRAPGTPDSAAAALSELLRVLEPAGELLVTVPFGAALDRGWFRVLDRADLGALLAPAERYAPTVRYFYYDRGWCEGTSDVPVRPQQIPSDAVTGVAIVRIVKTPVS